MKWIYNVLMHLSVVLAVVVIVLLVVDRLNPTMDFLGNTGAKTLIFSLSIVTLLFVLSSLTKIKK